MSAPFERTREIRKRVNAHWHKLRRIARLACMLWPWRNSLGNIAVAQLKLEVERAWRASAGRDERA